MHKYGDDKGQLKCSFCGKTQDQVKKLVAGPGVYICDECIELCNEIIEEELAEVLDEVTDRQKLILHNDDINTFDHVIDCLVRICKHDELQAEQCALLVHTKGKATVKTGARADLIAMCQALLDEGLNATIGE